MRRQERRAQERGAVAAGEDGPAPQAPAAGAPPAAPAAPQAADATGAPPVEEPCCDVRLRIDPF